MEPITPFLVMDILERAKALEAKGHRIIHFEVGEPDFDTPEVAKRAGIEAIEKGHTKYTHSLGTPELRREICLHYKKDYSVAIEPGQVIIVNGSSTGLFMTFAVLLEEGGEVVMGTPHYSCYPNYVHFMGGKVRFVPLREEEGFQLTKDRVEECLDDNCKAILVNSPANPTGAVMTEENLRAVASLGVPLVSDEIYHGLTYGCRANSALEFTDNTFVLSGFSKRYAMTGWRIGYVIAPPKYIFPMQKLQQNFQISPNAIAQEAALAALKYGDDDLEKMRRVMDERRKLLITRLKEMGFKLLFEPRGAFYVFVSARFLGEDSYKLAIRILEEAEIAVTPGIDFGQAGEGFLRFSYTTSPENIEEGMRRLRRFVEGKREIPKRRR